MAPSGWRSPRALRARDDAGNRPDHPVRVQPQCGFRPFQLAVRLAQLVPLDMDGGQGRRERRG
jgi:hypothetical protein